MYGKIFAQIFESSIADDADVRHIFMDLIVLADRDGVVDMTLPALARRTNVPLEKVRHAIEVLTQADPDSRSSNHDGKRLIPLDDHRNWGWKLVNYLDYCQMVDEESRKAYFREYRRRERAKKKTACSKAVQSSVEHVQDKTEQFNDVTHVDIQENINNINSSNREDIYINTLTRTHARSIYGDEGDSLTTSDRAAQNSSNQDSSQANHAKHSVNENHGGNGVSTRNFDRNSRVDAINGKNAEKAQKPAKSEKNTESAQKNRAELASNAPMEPSKGNPPSKTQTPQGSPKAREGMVSEFSGALPGDGLAEKSADGTDSGREVLSDGAESDLEALSWQIVRAFPKYNSSAVVFGFIHSRAERRAQQTGESVAQSMRHVLKRTRMYAAEVKSWPTSERGKCYSAQKFFCDEIYEQEPEFWRVGNGSGNRTQDRNEQRNRAVQGALEQLGHGTGNPGMRANAGGSLTSGTQRESDARVRSGAGNGFAKGPGSRFQPR